MEKEPKVTPEFTVPEPGRLQRLSIHAAGMLLKAEGVEATFHEAVTQIGGFDEVAPLLSAGDSNEKSQYKIDVSRNPNNKFVTGADYQDATGVDLAKATESTASGRRSEGNMSGTRRAKLAQKLIRYAISGVGAEAHLRGKTETSQASKETELSGLQFLPYESSINKTIERATTASKEVRGILLNGKLRNKVLNFDNFVRRDQEVEVRHKIADIYEKKPKLAEMLIKKEIMGFHGTRSEALAGVIEEGSLLSAAEATRRGKNIATGEHIFQSIEGQSSISFSSIAEIEHAVMYAGSDQPELTQEEAINKVRGTMDSIEEQLEDQSYSDRVRGILEKQKGALHHLATNLEENPSSLQSYLYMQNFPVLFGVGRKTALRTEKENWRPLDQTSGDYAEFRAGSEELPIKELIVAVPESRLAGVKELMKKHGYDTKSVISIEDLQPRTR